MRRRLNIRVKLAAALAVPLVALVAFVVMQANDAADEADSARRQADLASAALGPGGIVSALQTERNQEAIKVVGGTAEPEPDSEGEPEADQRHQTDLALATFRSLISRLDATADAIYIPALADAESGLAQARAQIDAIPEPYGLDNTEAANAAFAAYAAVIDDFQSANTQLAIGIEDPGLRTGAELLHAVSRQQELESVLARTAALNRVSGSPAATTDAIQLAGARELGEERIAALGAGPYEAVVDEALSEPTRLLYLDLLERAASNPGSVELSELVDASEGGQVLTDLQNDVAALVGNRADSVVLDAESRQRDFLYLGIGAVLVVLLITFLVSRSITRPLRRLTDQANAMATDQLPRAVNSILETPLGEDIEVPELAEVSVNSGGEVGRVARALDQVQTSAVELAVEQAVLRRNFADSFVNLGRRNQNLLGRQLDLVSDLEQSETDPDALENLFKIDHLATRMRRNAESLLVLAGLEPPRQWTAAIAVGDVVRGALGEVEDYRRVDIIGLDDAEILGSAASDITHILAELLENGLQFSPPSENVEVFGEQSDVGYVITVVDRGFGMSERDLAQANQRLAAAESFTVAPSRYLGHYVAAHLAQRHGVMIELSASPSGGVSASVTIPAGVADPDAHRPSGVDASIASEPVTDAGTIPEASVDVIEVAPVAVASIAPDPGPAASTEIADDEDDEDVVRSDRVDVPVDEASHDIESIDTPTQSHATDSIEPPWPGFEPFADPDEHPDHRRADLESRRREDAADGETGTGDDHEESLTDDVAASWLGPAVTHAARGPFDEARAADAVDATEAAEGDEPEPEPVAWQREPVAAEPEPVAWEPEPVAAEPEPVAWEPEPVAAEPEPEASPPPVDPVDPSSPEPDVSWAASTLHDIHGTESAGADDAHEAGVAESADGVAPDLATDAPAIDDGATLLPRKRTKRGRPSRRGARSRVELSPVDGDPGPAGTFDDLAVGTGPPPSVDAEPTQPVDHDDFDPIDDVDDVDDVADATTEPVRSTSPDEWQPTASDTWSATDERSEGEASPVSPWSPAASYLAEAGNPHESESVPADPSDDDLGVRFGSESGGGRTAAGLARRVRGAQLPQDGIRTVHGDEEQARTSARPSGEDVYSALADFRAGSERGRQQAWSEVEATNRGEAQEEDDAE